MNNCAKIVINISNFLIRQILRIFLIKPAIMFSITKFRPFPKPIFIGNFLNFSFGVKLCRNVRVTSYHLIENRQNTLNPRFYGRTWAEKVVERGSHDISLLHHYSDSDSNLWTIGCQARMHLLLPKLDWRIPIYIYMYNDMYISWWLYFVIHRLKLFSSASLDCRTGQKQDRYRQKELSFLLVLLP